MSGCQYGKDLKEVEIESDALFGHPADTNLGQARDTTPALHERSVVQVRARIGTCRSNPKIHVPILRRSLA